MMGPTLPELWEEHHRLNHLERHIWDQIREWNGIASSLGDQRDRLPWWAFIERRRLLEREKLYRQVASRLENIAKHARVADSRSSEDEP